MGLRILLHLHQVENVMFSDINLMNKCLMAQGMGELYSDLENMDEFNGPFEQDREELFIACREDGYFEGYENYSSIYGCFGEREMRTIARFLIDGKLVLHFDIEGNPHEYWVITPGKIEKKELTF